MRIPAANALVRVLLTAAVVIVGATRGEAGILPYVQNSDYPNNFNAITSQSQGTGGNYQSFDNFTLTSAGAINSITWQGFFWDPRGQFYNPVTGNSPTFQIAFFNNTSTNLPNIAGGAIGGSLAFNDFQSAPVGTAHFGPDNTGLNDLVTIFNYSVNLNVPFNAAVNTTYWLTIVSFTPPVLPSSSAVWLWTSGEGGDGKSAQVNYPKTSAAYVPGDRAFSLSASLSGPLLGAEGPESPPTGQLVDLPEPGSLVIMGTLLLVGGAVTFWRRQKLAWAITRA